MTNKHRRKNNFEENISVFYVKNYLKVTYICTSIKSTISLIKGIKVIFFHFLSKKSGVFQACKTYCSHRYAAS